MTMSTHTPPEVAKMLRVKTDKILAWIHAGSLKALNVAEKQAGRPRWRIFDDDLQAFLRSRQSVPPAPPQRRHKRRVLAVKQYF